LNRKLEIENAIEHVFFVLPMLGVKIYKCLQMDDGLTVALYSIENSLGILEM
jgi:hypothetical protein